LIGHSVVMKGNRKMTGCLQTFGGHCIYDLKSSTNILCYSLLINICKFRQEVCWIPSIIEIVLMGKKVSMLFPLFSAPEHFVIGLCPSSVVVRKPFYLNIFSSETVHWILTKPHRNDPWVVPYKNCSNGSDWLHK